MRAADPVARSGSAANGGDGGRVAIVGAGPAGLAAAAMLEAAGVGFSVFDEQRRPGGNLERRRADAPATPLERARHGRCFPGAEVLAVRPGPVLQATTAGGIEEESFAAVILATGAFDLVWPRPGLPDPRVSTAGALQALRKGQGVVPEGAVLLAGGGPFLHVVAAELVAAGAKVEGVVDRLPWSAYLRLARHAADARGAIAFARALLALRRAGTRLRFGRTLEAVEPSGARLGDGTLLPFDRLGITDGFAPHTQLARTAGCRLELVPEGPYMAVAADSDGRTSVPGIWVAGEATGVRGGEHARASGAITALAVLRALGRPLPPHDTAGLERRRGRHGRFGAALERLMGEAHGPSLGPDTAVLCACEGASVGEVRAAVELGLEDLGSIKAVTRCGMGPCQGRACEPLLVAALAERRRQPREVLRQKGLVKPVPAGFFARG
jgi:thioredoxin reductase